MIEVLDSKIEATTQKITELQSGAQFASNDIEDLQKLVDAHSRQRSSETDTATRPNVDRTWSNEGSSGGPTLKSLEQRVDHLEDHSRRDNLLFRGIDEEMRRKGPCADNLYHPERQAQCRHQDGKGASAWRI